MRPVVKVHVVDALVDYPWSVADEEDCNDAEQNLRCLRISELLKLRLISLTLAELEQIVLMIDALKTKRRTLGMTERKTTEAQR